MKDPELARDIIRAVREAITIPLTVKMRSGFDHTQRNADEIAWIAQEEGAEAITIHWRTRSDLYGGERMIDKIRETKDKLSIPVIGNGDVIDIPSAMRMFEETGCDGVMVGRGAIRNPWSLLQITQHLRGEEVTQVTAADRRRVLLGYLDSLNGRFRSERGTLGRFKKISNYFTKGLPYGGDVRTLVLRSQTIEEAVDHLEVYFERLTRFEAGESAVFRDGRNMDAAK